MQRVLDTNEYLFALGSERLSSSEELLEKIASDPQRIKVRICRSILDEIRRNSSPQRFKDFWNFFNILGVTIDEDWEVPFEIVAKYEAMGFKAGDAFIAGYTEYVGADCLVSENRADFLSRSGELPFKVASAESLLRSLI